MSVPVDFAELRHRSHSLLNRRQGSGCEWDSTPARLHQVETIVFAGQKWDHLEMEIFVPGSSKSTFGTCLWIGPRLGEVLLKGRERDIQPRPTGRHQVSGRLHVDTAMQDLGRNSRAGSPICRKELFPSRGYFTRELDWSDQAIPTTIFEEMAVGSSQEINQSMPSQDNLCC